MNCPPNDRWHLLSMELLGEAESTALRAHAQDCAACRNAYSAARRDHVRLLRAFELFGRRHEALREELMAGVSQEAAASQWAGVPQETLRGAERSAMRSGRRGLAKLAAAVRRQAAILAPAACLLVAVGVFLMLGRGTVALASALERLRQARTLVCDYTLVTTTAREADGARDEQTCHGTLAMYSDGLTRAWRLEQCDPPRREWLFPDHSVRIDADGERTVQRGGAALSPFVPCQAPEWWLARLVKLSATPDRELGRESIDGRPAVGFEIAAWRLGFGARPAPGADATSTPAAVAQLWVDAESGLPVRLRVENALVRMPGVLRWSVAMTWDRIAFDTPLDAEAFQPPPPAAGEVVEQAEDLAGAVPNEQALLDGLRAYAAQAERVKAMLGDRWAELVAGAGQEAAADPAERAARAALQPVIEFCRGYPAQLDPAAVMQAAVVVPSVCRANVLAARASSDAEAVHRAEEEEQELRAGFGAVMQRMQAMLAFYRELLVEDRAPEYFGATVRPGDADAVLLRWKLDEAHWRVIYGDLRAATVPLDTPRSAAP